jgi:pyruvate/2-oxoglutarate dehydrogenase complex dihydrolipoamide dehydrogenase (E3) component
MDLDFDLICLGSGPAGQRGAVQAAKIGAKVAVVSSSRLRIAAYGLALQRIEAAYVERGVFP